MSHSRKHTCPDLFAWMFSQRMTTKFDGSPLLNRVYFRVEASASHSVAAVASSSVTAGA